MASTVDTRMGLWKRVPGFAKMFMLGEAFVITFLSAWLYEEYVSNPFMQTYVNDFFRSDAGAMAVLGVIVAVVGLTMVGLLYRNRNNSEVRVGKIPIESAPDPPVPMTSPVLVKGVGPDYSGPLHPVVAALKAEIAGTPLVTVGAVQGLRPEEPLGERAETPGNASSSSNESLSAGTVVPVKKAEPEKPTGETTTSS